MKKLVFLFAFICFYGIAKSQTPQPEKWTFSTEKIPVKANDEYYLIFKVKLDPQWHMYSQFTDEGGPLPMVYVFDSTSCFTRIENVIEPEPHIEYDSIFMVSVKTFEGEVAFKQKVRINTDNCQIRGKIQYQICKELCIFKETEFSFTLNP